MQYERLATIIQTSYLTAARACKDQGGSPTQYERKNTHLIWWRVTRDDSLAKGGHLLSLLQHELQFRVPAWHEPHVGVNLEVELLAVPEVLRQVASLAGAGGFLPGYAHFSHLQAGGSEIRRQGN